MRRIRYFHRALYKNRYTIDARKDFDLQEIKVIHATHPTLPQAYELKHCSRSDRLYASNSNLNAGLYFCFLLWRVYKLTRPNIEVVRVRKHHISARERKQVWQYRRRMWLVTPQRQRLYTRFSRGTGFTTRERGRRGRTGHADLRWRFLQGRGTSLWPERTVG